MEKKTVIINFVAKHSYVFVIKIVEGLIHNGCRVIAIVSRNMPEIDQWKAIKGMKVYEVDGYNTVRDFFPNLIKYYRKDAPKLRSIAKKNGVDVLYLPVFTFWSVFINHSLREYRYVYAMHDPVSHNPKTYIHNYLNYKLGKNADKIVILSNTFRDYVKKTYKKSDKDIVVIPSGYEDVPAKPDEALVYYDNTKTNFLFQGRIDKYKGLEVLAEAYKRLTKEYRDITLTIAGSGDFSAYEQLCKELPNCTVINRWLTNEEVVSLFNDKSVITILPYTSATQSGVINVAMPCGSPIIASRCGGIPEQIIDGKTGYLVEPGNVEDLYTKMKYVIVNNNELNSIRANAYERMKSLSWDILAGKLMNIL